MAKYRLELVKLHCSRKQDTVGPDEPKIIVDGRTLYGPGDLGKGETVYLTGRSALFTGSAQVDLKEVDQSQDDDLGSASISGASDAGQGDLKREFHRTNSDYELTYRVVAA